MTIWLIATIGGLSLLLFLNRQGPRLAGNAPLASQAGPMSTEAGAMRQASTRGRQAPRGEAQMARWLRPSVQAARYAQPGRYPLRDDDGADDA